MTESLDVIVARLKELFSQLDEMPEPHRSDVYDLLDAVDELHRSALLRLIVRDRDRMAELAEKEPAVAWLFQAYELLPSPSAPTPVQISSRRPR